jgi:hypothetical protein
MEILLMTLPEGWQLCQHKRTIPSQTATFTDNVVYQQMVAMSLLTLYLYTLALIVCVPTGTIASGSKK